MSLDSDEKLQALGLKESSTTENLEGGDNFDRLSGAVDYDEFSDEVENASEDTDSFSSFGDWLAGLEDFTEDQASSLRDNIEQKVGENYNEFVSTVNENDNYSDWESEFRYGTTIGGGYGGEGEITQGVTFHESGGVSHSGVPIPAGTVEIFGPRIEISETDPPEDLEGEGIIFIQSGISPTNHEGTGTSEITGELENTSGSGEVTRTISLYVDGVRVESKTITLGEGEVGEVEFSYFFDEYGSFEVGLEEQPRFDVTVEHPSL